MDEELEVRRPKGEFPILVSGSVLQESVPVLFELLSGVGLPGSYLIEGTKHGLVNCSGVVQKGYNDLLNSFCSMLVDDGRGVNVFHLRSMDDGVVDEGGMGSFGVKSDSKPVHCVLNVAWH